ncbi:HK97 family phage prohead protease [Mesorhizobium sp. M0130]|uniref:HK97 family phage prohead protease n=1 Tax=unclassified Mesorhizobium TaxID=325217 RepID=UPI003335E543
MTRLEVKESLPHERFDILFDVKFASGDGVADGTIEGYASVFNLLDRGGDIVKPGAFKSSLSAWRKKKNMPPMLWSHNPDDPIGIWTEIAEDEKGLKVRGELILDVPQAKTVHALLKRGAVSGLSIGYRTEDFDWDRTTGARHLKKVELWEISLCAIPMLEEAGISGVKARKNFNPRDMEKALRDADLSRADAVKATAVFREWLQRDAGESEELRGEHARDLLMTMRKATEALRS